ncbi:hypothetical protein ONZ45_g8580 [Pleurotus djamor]|nr:hypothetical protein ONZ45_g8580 [Pleurotus djamor]
MQAPIAPADLATLFARLGYNPAAPPVATTVGTFNCAQCGVPNAVIVYAAPPGTQDASPTNALLLPPPLPQRLLSPPADNNNYTPVNTFEVNVPDAPGHWYSIVVGREVGVYQDWEGVASAIAFLEEAIVAGQSFTYHGL